MSILINMEMPSSCMGCRFKDYGTIDEWEMFCEITHEYVGNWDDKKWQKEWKPKNCPLTELPPHGRLIDGDALDKHIYNDIPLKVFGNIARMADMRTLIADAPTIIEAEVKE